MPTNPALTRWRTGTNSAACWSSGSSPCKRHSSLSAFKHLFSAPALGLAFCFSSFQVFLWNTSSTRRSSLASNNIVLDFRDLSLSSFLSWSLSLCWMSSCETKTSRRCKIPFLTSPTKNRLRLVSFLPFAFVWQHRHPARPSRTNQWWSWRLWRVLIG